MKHKLSIVAVLLTALLMSSTVMAQNNKPRTPPDRAKYNIIGTMNYRDGKRWLDNPYSDSRNGGKISFEYDDAKPAMPTDSADLEVTFEYVRTIPARPFTRLDFWRYDAESGEWIYDSEVRQGETVAVTRMQTNVMLVIDKSSSLKGDFPKVQEAAIEFVNQLYTASQEKGVMFRVGVIAFSTIKFSEVREISTLDAKNYNEIVSFIRGLKMENGTALYYSLDKALDMLEKDTRKNIKPEEYRESRIYAFTDGLDQASIDDKKGLTTPTLYYESLRPKMQGPQRKLIMNMPRKIVRSTMVTVRGDDMTEKQIELFDDRADKICDNVRKLDDMTKLVTEFKNLAADLVNSNFILKCYIPEGANGLVGWTFRDENTVVVNDPPKDTPEEKKSGDFWLGLGLEAGTISYTEYDSYTNYDGYSYQTYYDEYSGQYGHILARLDAAWPLSSKFAIGGTVGLGFSPVDGIAFKIGPIAKISFENRSALLLGLGLLGTMESGALYLNAGWKFKSPWYINAGFNVGDGVGFSIGVGYSICGGK